MTATLSLALADNVTVPLTVAPFVGAVSVTVGGVRSRTPVVKFQLKLLPKAFPTKSLTPLIPPVMVTVSVVLFERFAFGFKVAVRVAVS